MARPAISSTLHCSRHLLSSCLPLLVYICLPFTLLLSASSYPFFFIFSLFLYPPTPTPRGPLSAPSPLSFDMFATCSHLHLLCTRLFAPAPLFFATSLSNVLFFSLHYPPSSLPQRGHPWLLPICIYTYRELQMSLSV